MLYIVISDLVGGSSSSAVVGVVIGIVVAVVTVTVLILVFIITVKYVYKQETVWANLMHKCKINVELVGLHKVHGYRIHVHRQRNHGEECRGQKTYARLVTLTLLKIL